MSVLSYFLHRTKIFDKFESLTRFIKIDGHSRSDLTLNDELTCDFFDLGHKIYKQNDFVIYETILFNGKKIVRNHLSKHDKKGNLVELFVYYGDNDKFDNTFDMCYVIDLINESLATCDDLSHFWDEIKINSDAANNFSVDGCITGFLISKNLTCPPKQIEFNGKIACELLSENLEICYVDYLKYENMNVMLYCQKYDVEDTLNTLNNNINTYGSDIAKRKIIGHAIITSNDNIDNSMMSQIIMHALNFNQEKYEDKQKKELLKMYAKAYVIQNPK